MKRIFKTLIKNEKLLIAVCVLALTSLTIGASYAAFFTVKTNSSNQTITTGTLDVSYGYNDAKNIAITKTNMVPMSNEEGMNQNDNSVIFIQNKGTLPANYTLTVGYDMDNFLKRANPQESDRLTPLEYIMIAVYESHGIEGSTLVCGPLSLADLTVHEVPSGTETSVKDYRYNRYSLLFDKLGAIEDATKTYLIKMWLSDKANDFASNSYFYVNSEIIAEAQNTKSEYNINGVLLNNENIGIANAEISVQNGSLKTVTDEAGNFTLNSVLPGTYNIDITTSNKVYDATLTVREGTEISLLPGTQSFKGNGTMDLTEAGYLYGTTINKLKKINNIDATSSTYVLNSNNEYWVAPNYILTGGLDKEINSLTINIIDDSVSMNLNQS